MSKQKSMSRRESRNAGFTAMANTKMKGMFGTYRGGSIDLGQCLECGKDYRHNNSFCSASCCKDYRKRKVEAKAKADMKEVIRGTPKSYSQKQMDEVFTLD